MNKPTIPCNFAGYFMYNLYIVPELPEVQTTIKYLEPYIIGKTITSMGISKKGSSHFNTPKKEVINSLVGKKFEGISRIGKWILLDFGEIKAVAHLRMSGRYLINDDVVDHPHLRFSMTLEDGTVINYIDMRRFGTFHLMKNFSDHPSLPHLGPDALSPGLTGGYLFDVFQTKKKSIYSTLLDQEVIAGLGNIYVNEVLFATGIHPLRKANEVTTEEAKVLSKEIKRILKMALSFKGTTLIDNLYKDPEGNDGGFSKMLLVYGKKPEDGVVRIKIGGRSVFFKPETQKL